MVIICTSNCKFCYEQAANWARGNLRHASKIFSGLLQDSNLKSISVRGWGRFVQKIFPTQKDSIYIYIYIYTHTRYLAYSALLGVATRCRAAFQGSWTRTPEPWIAGLVCYPYFEPYCKNNEVEQKIFRLPNPCCLPVSNPNC